METKHQVFVSSTYLDLVEARSSVIHALLELDCIPAGMELFPAADEDAWTLIKEVIDGCDYYVLILAGKYGSMNASGISFTEMEYDYAVQSNKPIITFLFENLDDLPSANTEKVEAIQLKLSAFRQKVKGKHCKYWSTSEDLGGKVSRALVQLRKRHPSQGWVPGRYAASDEQLREAQELRTRVAQLELEVLRGADLAPASVSDLSQGSDIFAFTASILSDDRTTLVLRNFSPTWDYLFSYAGPSLMGECSDEEMISKICLALIHSLTEPERKNNLVPTKSPVLTYVTEDAIRIQFQALGLIAPGVKRRKVDDKVRYWRLTPYGEKYLLNLRAQRRSVPPA